MKSRDVVACVLVACAAACRGPEPSRGPAVPTPVTVPTPAPPPPGEVTYTVLDGWTREPVPGAVVNANGEQTRTDGAGQVPLVHRELHRIARHCMAAERAGHTLEPTALINEAYLRRIMVDIARRKNSAKRAGGAGRAPLEDAMAIATNRGPDPDLIALNLALEALSQFDQRKGLVVELRFFGGLSVEETAAALNVSPETVHRDWRLAKAWLRRELRRELASGC